MKTSLLLILATLAFGTDWIATARKFRENRATNEESLLGLYAAERDGLADLSQIFSKPPFSRLLAAFYSTHPEMNDDGRGLELMLRSLTASQIHGNETLKYALSFPNAFALFGFSDGVAHFEIKDSYERLKKIDSFATSAIVFEKELPALPSLCNPGYQKKWEQWTAQACREVAIEKSAFYLQFPESQFISRIEADRRETLKGAEQIQSTGRFKKIKKTTIEEMKRELERSMRSKK